MPICSSEMNNGSGFPHLLYNSIPLFQLDKFAMYNFYEGQAEVWWNEFLNNGLGGTRFV